MFFFFKQKTAYEMRISDWSSDVCSSDLQTGRWPPNTSTKKPWSMPMKISMLGRFTATVHSADAGSAAIDKGGRLPLTETAMASGARWRGRRREKRFNSVQRFEAYPLRRSEEHTSELQSLMRISSAVFCLKKKKNTQ